MGRAGEGGGPQALSARLILSTTNQMSTLFVRVFVPREELRGAIRGFLRDPSFGRSMRMMALLQFGVAAVFGVIGLWLALE